MLRTKLQRPPSAANPWVGTIGLIVLFVMGWLLLPDRTLQPHFKTIVLAGAVALSMCLAEILIFKTHRRESTGLDWTASHYDWKRIGIKMLGLGAAISCAAFLYYIFPVYRTGIFGPFAAALMPAAPYIFACFVIYITFLDGIMKQPEDSYYALGQLVLCRKEKVNFDLLAPLARSWLIKFFFIPAMFSFLSMNIANFSEKTGIEGWYLDRDTLFMLTLAGLFSIDLVFALIGYIFAFRIIDAHERSSDPTLSGWIAALFCYPPFSNFFEQTFLNYKGPIEWNHIFADNEFMLIFWAAAILLLITFYTWATIAFGLRFSNLTHRGIITSGPYRFTKHPAYIAKNLSWWLISIPFLAFDDPMEGLRHSILLLIVNAAYYLRAWTEERHLANDPVYRDYQAYIARHGIFRRINILPAEKIGRAKLSPAVVMQ